MRHRESTRPKTAQVQSDHCPLRRTYQEEPTEQIPSLTSQTEGVIALVKDAGGKEFGEERKGSKSGLGRSKHGKIK